MWYGVVGWGGVELPNQRRLLITHSGKMFFVLLLYPVRFRLCRHDHDHQLLKLREESRTASDRLEESLAVQKVHAGKVIDLKKEVRGGRWACYEAEKWVT